MPTTASSPPTTLIPASHTVPARVRHCHEVHRVGPIQGRRIALDQRRSTAGANSTTGPTAETRCAGKASVTAGLEGYYELAGAKEIGAAKPGEYSGAAPEITVRLAVCDHKARQGCFDGSASAKLTG